MATNSISQLRAWEKSHLLALDVYRATSGFPREERYGLVSQMRRAAVSVPANIAEGYKRSDTKEIARFYNLAEASLEELRYYFLLGDDLGFMNSGGELEEVAEEVAGMLNRLVSKLESRS